MITYLLEEEPGFRVREHLEVKTQKPQGQPQHIKQ